MICRRICSFPILATLHRSYSSNLRTLPSSLRRDALNDHQLKRTLGRDTTICTLRVCSAFAAGSMNGAAQGRSKVKRGVHQQPLRCIKLPVSLDSPAPLLSKVQHALVVFVAQALWPWASVFP